MTGAAPVIASMVQAGRERALSVNALPLIWAGICWIAVRSIARWVLPVGSRPSHWRTATPSPGLPDPSMLTLNRPMVGCRCGWRVKM